jgi:hypothetical protein
MNFMQKIVARYTEATKKLSIMQAGERHLMHHLITTALVKTLKTTSYTKRVQDEGC